MIRTIIECDVLECDSELRTASKLPNAPVTGPDVMRTLVFFGWVFVDLYGDPFTFCSGDCHITGATRAATAADSLDDEFHGHANDRLEWIGEHLRDRMDDLAPEVLP